MRPSKFLLPAFLIFLFMAACDPQMVYDQFKSTEGESWSWPEVKTFEVPMEDSADLYNMYINIRHTREYPKSNLYVFMSIEAPDGAVMKDTVDIQLADNKGKWLGHGFGNIKLRRKLYREGVRFSHNGLYIIRLEQAMRLDEVPVTDVGIRIEEYKRIK